MSFYAESYCALLDCSVLQEIIRPFYLQVILKFVNWCFDSLSSDYSVSVLMLIGIDVLISTSIFLDVFLI